MKTRNLLVSCLAPAIFSFAPSASSQSPQVLPVDEFLGRPTLGECIQIVNGVPRKTGGNALKNREAMKLAFSGADAQASVHSSSQSIATALNVQGGLRQKWLGGGASVAMAFSSTGATSTQSRAVVVSVSFKESWVEPIVRDLVEPVPVSADFYVGAMCYAPSAHIVVSTEDSSESTARDISAAIKVAWAGGGANGEFKNTDRMTSSMSNMQCRLSFDGYVPRVDRAAMTLKECIDAINAFVQGLQTDEKESERVFPTKVRLDPIAPKPLDVLEFQKFADELFEACVLAYGVEEFLGAHDPEVLALAVTTTSRLLLGNAVVPSDSESVQRLKVTVVAISKSLDNARKSMATMPVPEIRAKLEQDLRKHVAFEGGAAPETSLAGYAVRAKIAVDEMTHECRQAGVSYLLADGVYSMSTGDAVRHGRLVKIVRDVGSGGFIYQQMLPTHLDEAAKLWWRADKKMFELTALSGEHRVWLYWVPGVEQLVFARLPGDVYQGNALTLIPSARFAWEDALSRMAR